MADVALAEKQFPPLDRADDANIENVVHFRLAQVAEYVKLSHVASFPGLLGSPLSSNILGAHRKNVNGMLKPMGGADNGPVKLVIPFVCGMPGCHGTGASGGQ
jgi:hypothetical protein